MGTKRFLKNRSMYETKRNEMIEELESKGYDRKRLISLSLDSLYTVYDIVKRKNTQGRKTVIN